MCSPSLFLMGKFVIYISCMVVISVFIDMFVHDINVCVLICLSFLYNITIDCTLSWDICSISLQCMGYSTTASSLQLCLY